MKNLLIIGGTSGFGLIFARVLSKHYLVTITGRREISEPNLQSVFLDSFNLDVNWLRDYAPQIIINNGYDKKNHLASFDNSLKVVRESIKYFKKIGGGVLVNINSISIL
jgi:short-subunit dehydrogenase involved in D-alanine esterification of teichoic acids